MYRKKYLTTKERNVLRFNICRVLIKNLDILDFSPVAHRSTLDFRHLLSNLLTLKEDYLKRK